MTKLEFKDRAVTFLSQFDALHEQATQATGLGDFGSNEYQEPLRLMLRDADQHARLGDFGKAMLTGMIVGDLSARLRDEHGFKTYPQYLSTPIKKPIIIVGMMRSGTTVLHRLMGMDPAMQTLPMWLTSHPMPRPARETWESHPGYHQVQQGFDQLYQLSPQFEQFHPQSAAAADEDRYLLAHSFFTYTAAAMANIPEYADWLDNSNAGYAYRYYRKVIALIGGGSEKRWLLKCPLHLWHIVSLLEAFPDACIVMPHRDPVKTVTSIISLVYLMRKIAEPDTTPEWYGKDQLARWGRLLRKWEQDRLKIDPARIYDIHGDDIRADPVGSIERIYAHFDIPVSDEARNVWRQQVNTDPAGGHKAHPYTPEEFGITAKEIRESVGAHYERYLEIEKTRRSAR